MLGDDPRVTAAITAGIRQLNTAVSEQEQAAHRVLGLIELLMDEQAATMTEETRLRLEAIVEAMAFQDLTGQRIRKVQRLLKHLGKELGASNGQLDAAMNSGETADEAQQHKGLTQADVDRLLGKS